MVWRADENACIDSAAVSAMAIFTLLSLLTFISVERVDKAFYHHVAELCRLLHYYAGAEREDMVYEVASDAHVVVEERHAVVHVFVLRGVQRQCPEIFGLYRVDAQHHAVCLAAVEYNAERGRRIGCGVEGGVGSDTMLSSDIRSRAYVLMRLSARLRPVTYQRCLKILRKYGSSTTPGVGLERVYE